MSAAGLTPVGLTRTILRVETAAVAAGAIVATMANVSIGNAEGSERIAPPTSSACLPRSPSDHPADYREPA